MSREELYSNALTLTLAGAETTASALSAVTYMLGIHSDVKAKADQELRSAFSRESEIDMQSSMKLRYLGAVIDEAFRYHPPGPNALWRQTPPEGNWVLGDWIPGKVKTPKLPFPLPIKPNTHRFNRLSWVSRVGSSIAASATSSVPTSSSRSVG